MSRPHEDSTQLGPEDERLVGRLREVFTPGSRVAQRRQAFDAALGERLARPSPRGWAWTALATAGSAAALAWLLLPAGAPPPAYTPGASTGVDVAWESEVLFPAELSEEVSLDQDELLPPDYQALAAAFDF
jgi:hypothetical protein